MQMKEETALITGATSGIGRKIAELFLKEGAKITVCSRNEENVKKTVKELQKTYGVENVIGFACDVSDITSFTNVVDKTVEVFGSVRILVANAGLNVHYGPFAHLTPEQIQEDTKKVLGANLIGTINSISVTLPKMINQGYGRIVTLSGAGADSKRPMKHMTIYSASKGGIVSFSRCLAEELKSYKEDIKINVYQPGMIETNLGKNATVVNNWIGEETFRKETTLAYKWIGTDIEESVKKIIPFVIPSCKDNGKTFRGFSIRKMITGGRKLRKVLKIND
ncbi:MAG: putative ketoacyl reductase [Candidatus Heimdallarchaeota archaeon LC_3]|nr:MAG: putative ketoacyl reductase [Candidatus Heimdallarchaeota archaeon LC_3]